MSEQTASEAATALVARIREHLAAGNVVEYHRFGRYRKITRVRQKEDVIRFHFADHGTMLEHCSVDPSLRMFGLAWSRDGVAT